MARKMLSTDFANLKAKVKALMQKRKYQGSVESYGGTAYDYTVAATADGPIKGEHLKKILEPMQAINPAELPTYPGGLTEAQIALLESKAQVWSDRSITDTSATDCASSCTGTCTTTCQTGCYGSCSSTCGTSGCGSNCTGTCSGSACGNSCSGSCSGSACGNSCTGTCSGSACATNCSSTCGTSGCGSNCTGSCSGVGCGTGCSGSCSGSACGSNCTGGCGWLCMYLGGNTCSAADNMNIS